MVETKKEYTYKLAWSSTPDNACIRALVSYLKETSLLFRDSEAKLVTANEYEKMILDELIAPAKSYWNVKDSKKAKMVGLVILTAYADYQTTWDQIRLAKTDFQAGWDAAKRSQQ